MRWIAIAAVLALSSGGIKASDSVAADSQVAEASAPVVGADATATVTAIPSHSMVAELVKELKPTPEARPTKKLKVAHKKTFPKSLLSRTERHQLALLAISKKSGESSLLELLNEEDAGSSSDDLDLQRFFSRPKVVNTMDQDDEDDDLELSEAVKLRLLLARMQAVRAHERKFSSSSVDTRS